MWVCHYMSKLKRQSMEWKHRLSGKEKVLGRAVSKEGHANGFLDRERPITIDFLEKGATINSASYCQILNQHFTLFIEWSSYNYTTVQGCRIDRKKTFNLLSLSVFPLPSIFAWTLYFSSLLEIMDLNYISIES